MHKERKSLVKENKAFENSFFIPFFKIHSLVDVRALWACFKFSGHKRV